MDSDLLFPIDADETQTDAEACHWSFGSTIPSPEMRSICSNENLNNITSIEAISHEPSKLLRSNAIGIEHVSTFTDDALGVQSCTGLDHLKISNNAMSLDDFDLLVVVGRGTYGKVFQVRLKSTGKIYAMKVSAFSNLLIVAFILINRLSRSRR